MPEPIELSARQRRLALEALSRERLSQITEHYDLNVADRRVAASHVDAIVRAKRVDFAEVLGLLGRDELKAVCEALGLDTSGREKQTLLDRVLGRSNGAAAVSGDEVNPTFTVAFINRGLLRKKQGDLKGAARATTLQSALTPGDANAISHRAFLRGNKVI